MTGLLISFFLFTLAAVAAAGYVFVFRPSRAEGVLLAAPLRLARKELPAPQAAVMDIFRLIGEALPGNEAKAAALRRRLAAAGYRWPSAVAVFMGIRCAFAIMLAVFAVWLAMTARGYPSAAFLPGVCGLGFGYLLPDRVLDRLVARRVDNLRRALPAALDLMILAVEAGQGLDAAILETSRGLRTAHPDLASEFTQLHLELKADASRLEALKNLSLRTRDAEMRKFAGVLIDTDRFGTTLGPALRSHAKYLRTRFRQSAQERARKVAVKLIFPVFFLIFPSVILVTLGPAAIMLFTQMRNLLGQ